MEREEERREEREREYEGPQDELDLAQIRAMGMKSQKEEPEEPEMLTVVFRLRKPIIGRRLALEYQNDQVGEFSDRFFEIISLVEDPLYMAEVLDEQTGFPHTLQIVNGQWQIVDFPCTGTLTFI